MKALALVALSAAAATGLQGHTTATPMQLQAVRTCVDRWNESNMVG